MKQSGISSVLSVILFCLVAYLNASCSREIAIARKGKFYNAMLLYYFNDSIRFNIGLFGDYKVADPKEYKNQIKSFPQRNFLYKNFKTILFTSKTDIQPFFTCTASIGKHILPLHAAEGFTPERINDLTIFSRTKKNQKKIILEFIIPLDQFDIYLIASGDSKQNNGISTDFLEGQLRDEFNHILATIKKGEMYTEKSVLNPFDIADKAFNSTLMGNYLLPIEKIKEIEPLISSNDQRDFYLQALATYSSFINDPVSTETYLKARLVSDNDDSTKINDHNKKIAALQYDKADSIIIAEASMHKVVMFNESHFQPYHRLTVSEILEPLYNIGYRYLALECVYPNDTLLNVRKFPTQETGFYSREFHMANLIRTALKLGYRIVPYDYQGTIKNTNREYYQAYNLYNNIFKNDVEAKAIVLAGHSHILKEEDESKKRWMASYFEELSHITPFTIDQTNFDFFGRINTNIADGVYAVKDSTTSKSKCDLYLTRKYDSDKNDFNLGDGVNNTFSIEIPFSEAVKQTKGRKIIQIYLQHELYNDSTSLPCFIRRIEDIAHLNISIPAGKYVSYIKNEYGEVLEEKRITAANHEVKFE